MYSVATLLLSSNSAFHKSLSQSFKLRDFLDFILAGHLQCILNVSFYVEMYLLLTFISKGSQITLFRNILNEI